MNKHGNYKGERPCSFEGCKNTRRVHGLCMGHQLQLLRGKPLSPLRGKKPLRTGCLVPGCEDQHYAKGYCQRDYAKQRFNGNLKSAESGSGNYHDISAEDADAIRDLYAAGDTTYKELAEAYNVSVGTIGRIVRFLGPWANVGRDAR